MTEGVKPQRFYLFPLNAYYPITEAGVGWGRLQLSHKQIRSELQLFFFLFEHCGAFFIYVYFIKICKVVNKKCLFYATLESLPPVNLILKSPPPTLLQIQK